ncbi:MAG: Trm112 family protein [Nitrososphaerales archaeon]
MKKQMIDILACPIDKHHPLEVYEIKTDEDVIINGVLFCSKCSRFYPIIDEIPIMLPDELRNKTNDIKFLEQWKDKLPHKIINEGKPWHLE